MATPLRLLMLEDDPSDAELMLHALRRAGFDPTGDRVETELDFRNRLHPAPELILADFSMPEFNSLLALEILQKQRLDIPFIFVSGTIGEERAVEVMQRGADDYIMKDRLARLGVAVEHALEKKRMRTETKLAERRLLAQHAVTQALAESPSLAIASSQILCAICESLNWDFGALWQVDELNAVVYCVDCWRNPLSHFTEFEEITRTSKFPRGNSFPGRIWASGTSLWVAELNTEDPPYPRGPHAARAGFHGVFGFPIMLGTETLGILEFFSREIQRPTDETVKMMAAIGSQIGQFIERKRAEASLRQTNQTLQALIHAAPLAIVTLDQDSLITMWNTAAEQIFGWQAEEVLGKPIPVISDDKGKGFDTSNRLEDRRARGRGMELRMFHKNGSPIDVTLWTAPVTNVHGLIVGTMDLFLDVTGRKSLEEQFRQSQKMEAVGQLAAGVAHDFNNLLTIIMGYSEILLRKLPIGDRSCEPLGQIRKAGEQAAALTRRLLAFGRKQILAPVVLDINSLLTEIEKMLPQLIGADVELTTKLQPGLGCVRADPGQVEQIVMNLVVNARDAMPTGGRIVIRTQDVALSALQARQHAGLTPGSYTMLTVSDTGCGMDAATMARIFEPFYTTKEVGKGTGLGLATVFGIVKQSGGFIEVDSEPGSGSTFRAYLPQVHDAAKLKESRHDMVTLPKGGETILLVEDETGLRHLAQLILETSGYKVLSTCNGGEAVKVCYEYAEVIHLLFTDVVMPKMSGRQLTDLLVPSRPNMRVLFTSGYADDTMLRHGIEDIGTNFLSKPFTPEALAQKVRDVLDAQGDCMVNGCTKSDRMR